MKKLLNFSKRMNSILCLVILLFLSMTAKTQYIHTQGNQIVDKDNKPLFFSGMNLGNWLVWEGYLMMGDFNYRTHTQFFNSIKMAFGGNQTQALEFEHQWRLNYVTNQSIADLKNLGFNSVRIPFNYKLFWNGTTVTNQGFQYIDRAISYCKANGMYVLLDMHGAPGYQNPGDHSDNINSNASQPRNSVTFFDGTSNIDIAGKVWQHIANYYKNEPTIWGYDLLNEPVAQAGREYEVLGAMIKLRNAIRQVDNNHIIVAEGNYWGAEIDKLDWLDPMVQSKTGITSRWDNNLVYETHHYSSDVSILNGRLAICNKLSVPMVLGEYGENSDNVLRSFTDWCINNNVGYFPWSFKKMIHDKCLWTIPSNAEYDAVRNFINNGGSLPTNAYNNLISFCNNNIANGKPGLIFSQSFYNAVKTNTPAPPLAIPGNIEAEAYKSQSGVQLETCTDIGGGQNIAYLDAGDWTDYAVDVATAGTYQIQYRVASALSIGQVQLMQGNTVLATNNIPNTGGYQTWTTISNMATLPAGKYTLRLNFVGGNFNLNWIKFSTGSISTPPAPTNLTATATGTGQIKLQWALSSGATSYVIKRATTATGAYTNIQSGVTNNTFIDNGLPNGATYYYVVSAVNSAGASANSNQASATTPLISINAFATIEAESYTSMLGIQTESCSEGGLNVGYTDTNDYIAFNNVNFGMGATIADIRLASGASFTGTAEFRIGSPNGSLIGTVSFGNTGGWQNWVTKSITISNVSGMQNLYIVFKGGAGIGNINWIIFKPNNYISAFTKIEAERFNSMSGIQTETCSEGGMNIGFADPNDYIVFNNVNFEAGAASADIRLASDASFTGTAQFRLNSVTGPIIGTVSYGSTGGWQNWVTKTIPITGVTGVKNLYIVFQGGAGIGNTNWIKFNKSANTLVTRETNKQVISKTNTNTTLYPNPITNRTFHISINNIINKPVLVSLVDFMGNVMESNSFVGNEFTFTIKSKVPSGIYKVKIISGTYAETKQIILE